MIFINYRNVQDLYVKVLKMTRNGQHVNLLEIMIILLLYVSCRVLKITSHATHQQTMKILIFLLCLEMC